MKFPKELRLRTRSEYQKVAREGKRRVGSLFCIDVRRAKKLKIGITASGRFGSALERNRFKRLIREAFRQTQASLPICELNVIPRQNAKNARCSDILDELRRLCRD